MSGLILLFYFLVYLSVMENIFNGSQSQKENEDTKKDD